MFIINRKINKIGFLGNYIVQNKLFINSKKILSRQVTLLKSSPSYNFTNFSISHSNHCTKQYEVDPNDSEEHTINYDKVTKGDKELEHKLKVLMLEVEVLRQQGDVVPLNCDIKDEHWEHLLTLQSRGARKKYLLFLFKLSKKKENKMIKKLERQQERLLTKPLKNPDDNHKCISIEEHAATYELQHNSLFLRIYDSTINNFYNKKLIEGIQFEQKIVIDCGYAQNMTPRENKNCAKQLMLLFAENRSHSDPFDIHYANYNKESEIAKSLFRYIPTIYDNDFPVSIHEKSYLEIFPKEKLVYLTPHCKQEMETFDHDAVYIVGGIVDKVNNEPLSLAKAKKEGIKMLKFPLDKYLLWGAGSGKSLTLNQCIAILLDIRTTGNWEYALRHVPRRKLLNTENNTNIKDKRFLKFKRPTRIQRSNK